jgi:hypothetical protein
MPALESDRSGSSAARAGCSIEHSAVAGAVQLIAIRAKRHGAPQMRAQGAPRHKAGVMSSNHNDRDPVDEYGPRLSRRNLGICTDLHRARVGSGVLRDRLHVADDWPADSGECSNAAERGCALHETASGWM